MDTFIILAIIVVALICFFFFRNRLGTKRVDSSAPSAGRQRPRTGEGARLPAAPPPARTQKLRPEGTRHALDDADVEAEESGERERAARAVPADAVSLTGKPAPVESKAKRARPEDAAPSSKTADVETLRRGLARSRDSSGVFGKLKALFGGQRQIDSALAQEIEEVLLSSDVGAATTQALLTRLRDGLDRGELANADAVWQALREEAVRMLDVNSRGGGLEVRHSPTVVLFVGVNGAGKTTTIGKLATQLEAAGKKCVLAAGDTFRAAAVQQLVIWGKRVGCAVVHGKDGADPASVLFEAIKKAEELGADVVLADTAGRLHTKANLMNEMQKIARSAGKAVSGAPHETFLVIDATNGQNALAQAREFKEALNISGIVLTKLDGTAKGGVVLGICDSLRVPVRFVGMGEGPDDLHEFVPQHFVDALLGDEHAA